jgi:hypothetical protein
MPALDELSTEKRDVPDPLGLGPGLRAPAGTARFPTCL